MSAKKDLKYFMRSTEDEIVTMPGPSSFKDENGKVIDFEIRVLSQAEIQSINEKYQHKSLATDKRGNIITSMGEAIWKTEKDPGRASRHIIVEALQYPNLKDEELMKHYNCVDVTEMPLLVFSRTDEYAHVQRMVMSALGLTGTSDDNDEIEDAKNS